MPANISRKIVYWFIVTLLWVVITSALFQINSRFYYSSAIRKATEEMDHRIDTITLFTNLLDGDEEKDKLEEIVVKYVKSRDANITLSVINGEDTAPWRFEHTTFVDKTWVPVEKTVQVALDDTGSTLTIDYTKYVRPPLRKALLKAWLLQYRDFIQDKDKFQEHNLVGRDGPLYTYAVLVGFLLVVLHFSLNPLLSRAAERYSQLMEQREKVKPDILSSLIRQGESNHLEFKETLQFNAYTEKYDKEMVKMVMKTVAAFLNSDGGTLLVGVDDSGIAVGLDRDMQFFKNGFDGFELKLHDLVSDQIKPAPVEKLEIYFPEVSGRKICRIDVKPSDGRGVYHLVNAVYIRQGNRTKQLEGMALTDWIKSRKV